MQIKRISISTLKIPLLKPFVSAIRRVECTEDVVIEVQTTCGLRGFGVATPSLRMNGESVDSVISVIRDVFATKLVGRDVSGFEPILVDLEQTVVGNSAAKASIDIALHDLAAQSAGQPLYRFLGGDSHEITTGITISHNSLEEMIGDACAAMAAGFTTLKVKLGSPQGIEDDLRLIREIRRLTGKYVEIGVDANQAWSQKDSIYFAEQAADTGVRLAFIEQPVKSSDRSSLGRVTSASRIPVIADESCTSLREGVSLLSDESADGLAIKLMKLGGIRCARIAYDFAQLQSKVCVATCLTESPIGITAMASFCSGRKFKFVDLDSMALIAQNPVIGGATMISNKLMLNKNPGLGIQIIKDLEHKLTLD